MILIDAIYINNGGGKILLDYLMSSLNETSIEITYLLDGRIKNNHINVDKATVFYINGSFLQRHIFYKKNRNAFSKILCFGNLPPSVKTTAQVYTYFHQPIYLKISKEFSLFQKFGFFVKIEILKYIANKTDFWWVQSNFIKQKLHEKFKFCPENIKVLPFYRPFDSDNSEIIRKKNSFIYVSNGTPHKNHKRLLRGFCKFYDNHKKGKLTLTINEQYPEVLQLIANAERGGYPVYNIGYVDRQLLQKIYLSSEFLIFPSMAESFGLGLIEAIECGCKVIGANLPYTFEVCEPSLIFNPTEVQSIADAFANSILSKNLQPSVPKIKNNIIEIINILNNEN